MALVPVGPIDARRVAAECLLKFFLFEIEDEETSISASNAQILATGGERKLTCRRWNRQIWVLQRNHCLQVPKLGDLDLVVLRGSD